MGVHTINHPAQPDRLGRPATFVTSRSESSLNTSKFLDFVVIGASKSGTTSLFHYLGEHPSIWLPPSKDAPFFSADEWFEKGWGWMLEDTFRGAPIDQLWGTVTPRYMEDDRVPERMVGLMPHLKLVALLRNPIDRALLPVSSADQETKRNSYIRTSHCHPTSSPLLPPGQTLNR